MKITRNPTGTFAHAAEYLTRYPSLRLLMTTPTLYAHNVAFKFGRGGGAGPLTRCKRRGDYSPVWFNTSGDLCLDDWHILRENWCVIAADGHQIYPSVMIIEERVTPKSDPAIKIDPNAPKTDCRVESPMISVSSVLVDGGGRITLTAVKNSRGFVTDVTLAHHADTTVNVKVSRDEGFA